MREIRVVITVFILMLLIPHTKALTKVMDFDYNDDGVIDVNDVNMCREAMNQTYSSSIRMYDNNYDYKVDRTDLLLTQERVGLRLSDIQNNIKLDTVELKYQGVEFTLYVVNPAYMSDQDAKSIGEDYYDWLDIHYHRPSTEYSCADYSLDFAKCAYKDLGPGVVVLARGHGHAYNMFLIDKDWHNLSSWMVIEPTSGLMWVADSVPNKIWETKSICVPIGVESYPYTGKVVKCLKLSVDYSSKKVDYGGFDLFGSHNIDTEEPAPSFKEIPSTYISISPVEVGAVGAVAIALILSRVLRLI